MAEEILLDAYAARQCPRVTHNKHAALSVDPAPLSDEARRLVDAGVEWEQAVVAECKRALGDALLDLDGVESRWRATLDAMDRGVPVIASGVLPHDGRRRGAPDLLVRSDGGYLPVDIKHHGTFGKQKRAVLTYSSLTQPAQLLEDPDRSGNGSHRKHDCLQLAHYTRMLQALGHHPVPSDQSEPLWAGIVGTPDFTDITGEPVGITWYDLTEPYEVTYSASEPGNRATRSAMERYDHEFAFRVEVAEAARAGSELVVPLRTTECDACDWRAVCSEMVPENEMSFALDSGWLSARGWRFFRDRGVTTVDELADVEPDDVADDFARYVVATSARRQLQEVTERARMTRDDVDLEPIATRPPVPSADVEVDFDIEWDNNQRIYQWGLRVRYEQDEATAVYEPVVTFDPLDEAAEAALADRFADRLEEILATATALGRTVAVFHWTSVEEARTRKFPRVASLVDGHLVDLAAWLRQHYRSRAGFSIKQVAGYFGFEWPVHDAGGFSSMHQIDVARGSSQDAMNAQQWCLDYNEADVAAQAAIRDGLRQRLSR